MQVKKITSIVFLLLMTAWFSHDLTVGNEIYYDIFTKWLGFITMGGLGGLAFITLMGSFDE